MLIIVIPEDFRKDQYILKPLFEQLLHSIRRKILASKSARNRGLVELTMQ